MSQHLKLPLIRITPKYACGAGVIIAGYIIAASHTYLKVSGLSITDITKLNQLGISNKIVGQNSFVIDLESNDYSELD